MFACMCGDDDDGDDDDDDVSVKCANNPPAKPSPTSCSHCGSTSPPSQPMGQSGWRCVRDRSRFTRKQLPASSKRATGWERPPPTPQTPAASVGAAAVAAPGNNTPLLYTLSRDGAPADAFGVEIMVSAANSLLFTNQPIRGQYIPRFVFGCHQEIQSALSPNINIPSSALPAVH